jgi:uncharacterized protein involved in oxidation of intracellular sulfur
MNVLLILNDPPYGTERSYDALRLALALTKVEGTSVRVFLMADAIGCARRGQTTPDGYYNLERMLKGLTVKSVAVGACGNCMDARGFAESDLADGVHRSSMVELAGWTLECERVLVF